MAAKPKRSGLGLGLGALIPTGDDEPVQAPVGKIEPQQAVPGAGVIELKLSEIEPNTHQPRKAFDKDKIEALADSIKEHGLIQPIIVTKKEKGYGIIAGERRWRAARVAGLKTVPVIIKEATPQEVMELALIENLQREDLNPIEEAEAYERLMKEYSLTQENISKIVSKSRPAIANSLRLLNCETPIKKMLIQGTLSAGHARAILGLDEEKDRLEAAKIVVEQQISVRETELLVKKILFRKEQENRPPKIPNDGDIFRAEDIKAVQNKLKSALGTKVKLEDKGGKGKIVIEYYSADERERLIDYLTEQK